MNKYAKSILNSKFCNVCPRKCNIDRANGVGFCGAKDKAVISKIMIHNWEEPFLTNSCSTNRDEKHGSGAIFFSGCNLKCVYCQNYEISSKICGKEVTDYELAEIFKLLESKNVCNINLVTPTHFVKQIIGALSIYKPKIPIVYNSSGYETIETIKALEGLVDIYLFDFKYINQNTAKDYSNAINYPEICKNALLEAKKQVKNEVFDGNIMQKGIVIRHLLLPGESQIAILILNFIKDNLGKNSYVSLLNQYAPFGKAKSIAKLNKRPTDLEYKRVVNFAKSLDMPNIFLQDKTSANDEFVPDFSVFCDF